MKIELQDYMSALIKCGYTVSKTVAKTDEIKNIKFPSSLVSFNRAILMTDGVISPIKSSIVESQDEDGNDIIALENEAELMDCCTWVAIVTLINKDDEKKVIVNIATTSDEITVDNCDTLEVASISSI